VHGDSTDFKAAIDQMMSPESWPAGVCKKTFSRLRTAVSSNNLSLYSFNCHSVKNSLREIGKLSQLQFIFLQEHWLLPRELKFNMLSSIHSDFWQLVTHQLIYGGTDMTYRPLQKIT